MPRTTQLRTYTIRDGLLDEWAGKWRDLVVPGRQEEAIGWLWDELRSGNEKGLWIAAELLARMGRVPESERLRRYGVAPDGSIAQPWKVIPPEHSADEHGTGPM